MSLDSDVIILGAGAAGLSAAVALARGGLSVIIPEARDRLGGRMFTRYDSGCNAPVELGAEFIHGCPPEIWNLLRRHNIAAREVSGDNWCVRDGKLYACDFFSELHELLEKMDDHSPDESFLEFLERCCPDPNYRDAKERARGFVTGFHAADPSLISVHSLVKGLRADEKIKADRDFRIANGYEALVNVFRQEMQEASVSVHLNTCAENIRWAPRRVQVGARTASGPITFTAPRVLVTLPLGVLQATTGKAGPVEFIPELPPMKQQVLAKLEMGKVLRVTLRFRQRFWEGVRPTQSRGRKTLAQMSFLFTQQDWFPTWWTSMPERLPIITAWAPFHCAERLSGRGEGFVVEKALDTLGRVLKFNRQELENLLAAAYFHDWQTDPFSRGAYSYVKVGGDDAQHGLAAPVENTLFFAGEATDVSGHNGTVHGAIASGHRAAAEILGSAR